MAFRSANAMMAADYAGEQQQMQRDQQDFMEEQGKAQSKAEKKAKKASLWSGLGGALGGLGAAALTVGSGGILGPAALAMLMTYGGSKLASSASDGQLLRDKQVKMQKMAASKGKYMSGKRQTFEGQKKAEVDALKQYQDDAARMLSEGQITGAATSGVTAGMGQIAGGAKLFEGMGKTQKVMEVGSNLAGMTPQFGKAVPSYNDYSPQFNYEPQGFGTDS